MRPIFVNGKFCAQRTTGVQRFARNVVTALDAHLTSHGATVPWTLLLPTGAEAPKLQTVASRPVPWTGPGGLIAWEQIALPLAARGGVVVSLAGSGPAWTNGPRLCVVHDAGPFDEPWAYRMAFRVWYRGQFRRWARDDDTTVITVSSFSKDRLSHALPPRRREIAVVHGGAEHLGPLTSDKSVLLGHGLDRVPFLLAVGSRNPRKNISRLREAWRLMDRRDLRLVIVGGADDHVFADGGPTREGTGTIDLGPVDDEALKALYEHARALVFPSLYEGFGLPPLEAMHCGCPVAAADIPVLREVCGDAAMYFDPTSPAQIAAALNHLIESPGVRDGLRSRGYARAAQFRWDAAAAAVARLVSEVA